MRVALVSMRFDTRGGSERRTFQLARGLISAGHAVEVFAANAEDVDIDAGINIVPMSGGPSFLKVMSFTKNVNRMLAERHDIDIVHNQIRPFTDGIVTVGGGCHAENLERRGGYSRYINPLHHVVLGMERERYMEGGCQAVITNSEFSKKGILRHYPMPPEKVFVAYNGVDSVKFNPGSAAVHRVDVRSRYGINDEPVLLFLGSGFRRKGLQAVIKALSLLKGSGKASGRSRLIVVGKDRPAPYMKLAARLGVSDRITFAGPTRTPEAFYGAADIFILPTRYDPFSNATLEAMACGLPVITTHSNGVSEIIQEGENGFVLKSPDDCEGIAETVDCILSEGAGTSTGANARSTVEKLTWDSTLASTLAVYEAVLLAGRH